MDMDSEIYGCSRLEDAKYERAVCGLIEADWGSNDKWRLDVRGHEYSKDLLVQTLLKRGSSLISLNGLTLMNNPSDNLRQSLKHDRLGRAAQEFLETFSMNLPEQ